MRRNVHLSIAVVLGVSLLVGFLMARPFSLPVSLAARLLKRYVM